MKKWIKTHWRIPIMILCLLLLANAIWGTMRALQDDNDLFLVLHIWGATLYVFIIGFISGGIEKFYNWWRKD